MKASKTHAQKRISEGLYSLLMFHENVVQVHQNKKREPISKLLSAARQLEQMARKLKDHAYDICCEVESRCVIGGK
jgi:hypothetical protein